MRSKGDVDLAGRKGIQSFFSHTTNEKHCLDTFIPMSYQMKQTGDTRGSQGLQGSQGSQVFLPPSLPIRNLEKLNNQGRNIVGTEEMPNLRRRRRHPTPQEIDLTNQKWISRSKPPPSIQTYRHTDRQTYVHTYTHTYTHTYIHSIHHHL